MRRNLPLGRWEVSQTLVRKYSCAYSQAPQREQQKLCTVRYVHVSVAVGCVLGRGLTLQL